MTWHRIAANPTTTSGLTTVVADVAGTSEDAGNDLVGHLVAVLLPVDRVLLAAFLVVAEGAVDEENGEEDEVGVGHDVSEPGRRRPQVGQEQLGQVVEVAGEAPVAGHQQQTSPPLAGHRVRGVDHFRSAAPHQALGVGSSHVLLLLVGEVVDDDGRYTGR